ncbi:MAG: type I secretion protein, partial [Pseudomonadota bacterium]
KLMGYTGDDTLDGGAGKDTLYLGAGSDVATGGADSDRFIFRADDLDGSTDRITDFRNADGESDQIDLRGLDLLTDGMTADQWISTFVFKQDDNSVQVDLGECTINFDARLEDPSDLLYQEICDGFLF